MVNPVTRSSGPDVHQGTAPWPIPRVSGQSRQHRIHFNVVEGRPRVTLIERATRRNGYRLSDKGTKAALMFILFHKRVCGPLANSLFHHRPDEPLKPASKVEAAYHKADRAIQQVLDLLAG